MAAYGKYGWIANTGRNIIGISGRNHAYIIATLVKQNKTVRDKWEKVRYPDPEEPENGLDIEEGDIGSGFGVDELLWVRWAVIDDTLFFQFRNLNSIQKTQIMHSIKRNQKTITNYLFMYGEYYDSEEKTFTTPQDAITFVKKYH